MSAVTDRSNKSQSNKSENMDEKVKREVPTGLRKIMHWDAVMTNELVDYLHKKMPDVSKSEAKVMEISGSGFVWLPGCIIMYLLHPTVPRQFAVNLLIALLLDIIIVGLMKAFFRRRRPPTKKEDFFKSLGPDQYSFPSGHASRSVLISLIFSCIDPLFVGTFFQLVVATFVWTWCLTVCISRLINGRHYFLDVVVGVVVGFLESFIIAKLWMSSERAENFLSFFSEEVPEI